ncbi:hypothetical protein BC834DRAFT_663044 [Gloeopeniophorella convolvens]|nr:hypothetical protein BC834DRAFT_663044 [Gloeopeniophorella convolvens]
MAALPDISKLDDTIGAVLLGIVLSAMVYGANVWQAFSYYTKYSLRDGLMLKSFVALLLAADTLSLALGSHVDYTMIVTDFDNIGRNLYYLWSYGAAVILPSAVNASVRNFFAHRIYTVSQRTMCIPIVIVLSSIISFIFAIVYSIPRLQRDHIVDDTVYQARYMVACFAFQALCDTSITFGMIFYLSKRRGNFRRTNSALNMLIFYSFNCGVISVFCVTMGMICLIELPRTLIWTAFPLSQTKLYFCSFMAILNSRDHVRGLLHRPDGLAASISHP